MPVVKSVLLGLITQKVSQKMHAYSGYNPLAQRNPSYFIEMCKAISYGIAEGTPLINFTTSDTGLKGIPPVPGSGTGMGVMVKAQPMSEFIYTFARDSVIAEFGRTEIDVWPPRPKNYGQFLKCITDGVAESVQEHYATAWTFTSVHPAIYTGDGAINDGMFSGISAELVKSLIISYSPSLRGRWWPKMAQAIADGYVKGIHTKSTGSVVIEGSCIPDAMQVCAIPGTGSGTGVAA